MPELSRRALTLMPPFGTNASQPQPKTVPSPVAVLALWVFIAGAVIVMTSLGISLKSGKIDLLERTIWDIGWIGWAPLTFLVLSLCRRNPIGRGHRLAAIVRLAAYGVGVVGLEIVLDFTCNAVLGLLFRGTPVTWKYLLYITVYKAHIYYGVYWMLVGAAHALEFHRRFRESELVSSQLEAKLANAELDRLKAQLQPHFLFNAHNTIVSLMLKNENAAAIRMLTRLSDLLRISLSRSGHQVVTVKEELELLGMYLEIQRERFRDRLTVKISAVEDVADAEIPHLLLQPLVENALLHGLEHVTQNAQLEIQVTRLDDTLRCQVRDNGSGFVSDRAAVPDEAKKGIGISNTRERLRQLYGQRQNLSIESTPGKGCTVSIWLPFRSRASLLAFR